MSGDGFALVAKAENSKGIHNMLSAIHLKKDIVRMPLPLSSEEAGILFSCTGATPQSETREKH
jgi:hypothetical protein